MGGIKTCSEKQRKHNGHCTQLPEGVQRKCHENRETSIVCHFDQSCFSLKYLKHQVLDLFGFVFRPTDVTDKTVLYWEHQENGADEDDPDTSHFLFR